MGNKARENLCFTGKNGIDGWKSMAMKKRESSYIRKSTSMVVKGLLVLLMASQVTSVCHTDSQCPGDQVCIIETRTQKSANHKNFKVEVSVFWRFLESPQSNDLWFRSLGSVVVREIISFGSGIVCQEWKNLEMFVL